MPKRTKEKIDKNYDAGNTIIRWLVRRLVKRISDCFRKIDAPSGFGLDIGCGEGNIIHYLSTTGVIKNLVAVDLNRGKIEYAREHYPVCSYVNADACKLVFKDNSFDYIMAAEIFEHLPDYLSAINEIKRVAKKGAYLIISVPHEPYFRWGNLIRGKYWGRYGKTPAHVNFWTRMEFKNILNEHLAIEEEYCFSVFPWLLYIGRFK